MPSSKMNEGKTSRENELDAKATLNIKRLTEECGRGAFLCGDAEIDRFFKNEAWEDQRKLNLLTWAAHLNDDQRPMGFYSLTVITQPDSMLDGQYRSLARVRLSKGQFASIRLGWLAVKRDLQGQGWGTIMMGHIIRECYEVIIRTGIFGITLTARNTRAAVFYERLGFVRYGRNNDSPDMFLPAQSVSEITEQNA